MADPFIAEIRIFPFSFAPYGWAWCDGQLLPIAQNTPLFALIGTTYGGNGSSNFALPDLQGRAAMHPGEGVGRWPHDLGETGGTATVTLLESEIPSHTHPMRAGNGTADISVPGPDRALGDSDGGRLYQPSADATLAPDSLTPAGGGLPHNNMQPYLTTYFAISMRGEFPQRGD